MKKLNQIQLEYVNLMISYFKHIKNSNDFTSGSLPCALEDELNSILFELNEDKNMDIINKTINNYNSFIKLINQIP